MSEHLPVAAVNADRLVRFKHVICVEKEQTADFQMTAGIARILAHENNPGVLDDLVAFMQDKNLPVDEIEARKIAEDILKKPPRLAI